MRLDIFLEQYLPVSNIKNLYLPVLNIFGLSTFYVYFTQTLDQKVSGALILYGVFLLSLTMFSTKTLVSISKLSLIIKILYIGVIASELPVSVLVFLICAISFLKQNFDEKTIIKSLKKIIPSYMIPNKFLFFKDLPKNPNGKIDRKKIQNYIQL